MLIRFVAAAALLAGSAPAQADAPRLPPGRTCEDVRSAVDRLGWPAARQIAIAKGYTVADVAEARKCLRS